MEESPWWIDPLAYRLTEAKAEWDWRGDHVGALLLMMLAQDGPALRKSLARMFEAHPQTGAFFTPARAAVADPRWSSPYRVLGRPAATLRKSDVLRVGVLADLTSAQLTQINGVALVLVRAANAFSNPLSLEKGGPQDSIQAGDPVKSRVA
jgi:hypothetical protein